GWTAFFAGVASVLVFAGKTLFFVFVVMWLRWKLPRIRVDQMMNMCWKYLVPASFAGVLFVAVWMLIVRSAPAVGLAMNFVLSGAVPRLPRSGHGYLHGVPGLRARLPHLRHQHRHPQGRREDHSEAADGAVRHRHRQVHVLRALRRALSDRRHPAHARVRRRG